MNKILQHIGIATLAFCAVACAQFDEVKGVEEVEAMGASVAIKYIPKYGVPAPASYKVKLNNFSERYEMIKTIGADGCLDVAGLIPGVYTIAVSAEVSYNGFSYNVNGNLTNVHVFENNKKLEVEVTPNKAGGIIFKELYYCCSRTLSNSVYIRDQFYELYNNSNMVLYADGLCIGSLLPNRATATPPKWNGENPENYLYFETIWQVPGSGKEYPIQPGESFIIAQMADDHQRKELNPKSPVNLLSAEFETMVATTSLIKDNPAINMTMAFWPKPSPQWLVTVFGGAYALFYPSSKIDPNDFVTQIASTVKGYRVPIDKIVDVVELIDDESKMKLKRIPTVLDAGAATVGGTYLSKSVARKIKERLPDGRIIFEDTNNSTEDFEVKDLAVIRRYGSKIPVWNTWAN